ncbi:hypothetical protein U1Q18_033332 [Sarracenia purpurea var. burkii]
MAEECNLADFVDCSPICSDISADSMLEALRAELKQAIGNDPTDPQKEPDEAQSALRPVAEESKEVGDAGTGNQPVLDQQTIVTAPAPEVALALAPEAQKNQFRSVDASWLENDHKRAAKWKNSRLHR